MRVHLLSLSLVACSAGPSMNPVDAPDSDSIPGADASVDAPANPSALPLLQPCTITDPNDPTSAVVEHPGPASTFPALTYTCAQPCNDGVGCGVDFMNQGSPVMSSRGGRMQIIEFVVDGMAGHFIYTPDGDDILVTHGGVGGTGGLHDFDREVQTRSAIRTVSLGWERGVNLAGFGGTGWFTRKDALPTSIRALAARPASAIQWIKTTLGANHKLGTVGASLGTAATFGAHVWWDLDSIIDYQMFIGGPPIWDINMGCGRAHTSAGHCDVDVAPCTGNPSSSYGNDDPSCGSPTNQCRVPTIMAQLSDGSSEWNHIVNYYINGTICTAADTRDAVLDESSLATTVTNWSFHGPLDFVTQEGAPQPPQSDQGMGEGHAMYVYLAVQSQKRWIDDDGHHHGDAWQKDPTLVGETAQIVVDAMSH